MRKFALGAGPQKPANLKYCMEKNKPQKVSVVTKDGQPFQVPKEGSLGLLALGYKGLVAWRQVRRQYQKAKKEQLEKENTNADNLNPDNIFDQENN